jgi:GntR family transcriptional regulator, transcriptional repressor for pyruvate dehydrogenase complex
MANRIVETVSRLNLRRAKPVRLFDQAVEQIKALIVDGRLKPGDKLPSENELSQMLDVSRSSVREALRALESNGLIQVKSGAGAFVSDDARVLISLNDTIQALLGREDLVLQLLQVRGAIEGLAASLAATSITENELAHLRKILNSQETLIRKSPDKETLAEIARLDAGFHIAIGGASKNEIISEITGALLPNFIEDNQLIISLEKGSKLLDEHKQILEALAHHDPARAEAAMRNHIGRVISEIERFVSIESGKPDIQTGQ